MAKVSAKKKTTGRAPRATTTKGPVSVPKNVSGAGSGAAVGKAAAKKVAGKASAGPDGKVIAKKTAAKKTATKKTAAKRTGSKKTVAKKVAAKVASPAAVKRASAAPQPAAAGSGSASGRPAPKKVSPGKAVAKKPVAPAATPPSQDAEAEVVDGAAGGAAGGAAKTSGNDTSAKPAATTAPSTATTEVAAGRGASSSAKRAAAPSPVPTSEPPTATMTAPSRAAANDPDVAPTSVGAAGHYMTREQLDTFSRLLREWKRQLMEEVDRTVGHMKDDATNFPDPNDRATQEEEFSLELRTRDRERKLIKKINEAQKRIEEGEYGYCESCGIEIGVPRLQARLTAELCIDCKTLEEIRERQTA